jgi:hypothetical protein
MLAPREISIYLNNALKATHVMAELDSDTPLPEISKEMPQQVSGRFVGLEEPTIAEIRSAWKRVMTLNSTPVVYDFTYDPAAAQFTARRR